MTQCDWPISIALFPKILNFFWISFCKVKIISFSDMIFLSTFSLLFTIPSIGIDTWLVLSLQSVHEIHIVRREIYLLLVLVHMICGDNLIWLLYVQSLAHLFWSNISHAHLFWSNISLAHLFWSNISLAHLFWSNFSAKEKRNNDRLYNMHSEEKQVVDNRLKLYSCLQLTLYNYCMLWQTTLSYVSWWGVWFRSNTWKLNQLEAKKLGQGMPTRLYFIGYPKYSTLTQQCFSNGQVVQAP